MPAGGNHHEPAPLDDIAGGMLVGMAVRDEPAAPLVGAVMIGGGRLDQRVGQDALEGLARDTARCKRAGERTGMLARHGLDPRRFQAVARRLPVSVETVRLYESYLMNFQFANGE